MGESNKKLLSIYREAKGKRLVLSKGEFAEKLGYSRAHIHQLMSSDDSISIDILSKAESLLQSSPPVVIKDTAGRLLAALIRVEAKLNIMFSNEVERTARETGRNQIEVYRELNRAVIREVDNLRDEYNGLRNSDG